VRFADLRDVDPGLGVSHARPRQAYSFSPVKRS